MSRSLRNANRSLPVGPLSACQARQTTGRFTSLLTLYDALTSSGQTNNNAFNVYQKFVTNAFHAIWVAHSQHSGGAQARRHGGYGGLSPPKIKIVPQNFTDNNVFRSVQIGILVL